MVSYKLVVSMKNLFNLLLCLLVISCSSAPKHPYITYKKATHNISVHDEINILITPDIRFMGHSNNENDVTGTGMMYPGANAGVFIASILTHAAVSKSSQNSKKSSQQALNNEVLSPYQPAIQLITNEILTSDLIGKEEITKYNLKLNASQITMQTSPVFLMTQNQKQFILQNKITLKKDNKTIYKNMIEVISSPITTTGENEIKNIWLKKSKPSLFSSTVRELYKQSVVIALDDLHSIFPTLIKDTTHTYELAGKKSYERGKILAHNCTNTIIRTLRGWIKSTPSTTCS